MPPKLRKLLTLANFLDDLPCDRFYMPRWSSHDATDTSCGTAGCIAGWAATIFHREGWYFEDYEGPCGRIPCIGNDSSTTGSFADFFGISPLEAFSLCTCQSFKTPRDAAAAIRDLVRRLDPTLTDDAPPEPTDAPVPCYA